MDNDNLPGADQYGTDFPGPAEEVRLARESDYFSAVMVKFRVRL